MAITKGRNSSASSTKTLKAGDKAPEIELQAHNGDQKWKLSEQKGKNVVLAFYPFAFTPVWTAQMPSYEENLERFKGYNAEVVGISIDHKHANVAWAKSLGGITYPLLCDFYPHGAIAEKYGVLRAEGMAERAIFIIDKDGIIRYIDVHAIGEQPDEEQIFDELRKLA